MKYKIIRYTPKEDINYIMYLYKNNRFNELEVIGAGNSTVYKYKNYAIKDYSEEGYDGIILEKLQDNLIFPKLYFYTQDFMVVEYLDITNAYNYYERNVNTNLKAFDIFKYCYKKGLIPRDIHDENVVVTKDDRFKIIDVGNFGKIGNKDFDSIILENKLDYLELDNIINHIKVPPIVI